jgi:threonine aldolase
VLAGDAEFIAEARRLKVLLGAGKVRMLTHRDITTGDVDAALAAWRKATGDLAAQQPGQA